jgi:hypothetical protein
MRGMPGAPCWGKGGRSAIRLCSEGGSEGVWEAVESCTTAGDGSGGGVAAVDAATLGVVGLDKAGGNQKEPSVDPIDRLTWKGGRHR